MVRNIQEHWERNIESGEEYTEKDKKRERDYEIYKWTIWKYDNEDEIGCQ